MKRINIKNSIITGGIRLFLVILLLLLPFLITAVIEYFSLPDTFKGDQEVSVLIPKGSNLHAIAEILYHNGLIKDKDLFIFWVTSLGEDKSLKAGLFKIPKGLNYAQLVNYLSTANSVEIKVTLLEGWRVEQIVETLADKLGLSEDKLTELTSDTTFFHSLGIKADNIEGYLLPDTYYFYWGMDEVHVISFLVKQCLNLFPDEIIARIDSMGMNIHKILTLASIIEGEAIFDDERPVIASVFYNRLKKRMKLQACATIQYIKPGPPSRLLISDLEIESPYNTYKHYGLPPGPINNPGENSIMAAIYPQETDYLYFVAKGDGGHTFSHSGKEHLSEKEKFDQIRRKVYRKKRKKN